MREGNGVWQFVLLQLFLGQDLSTTARIATFHFSVVTKNMTVEGVRYLLGVLVLKGLGPGVSSFGIVADSPVRTRPQGFRNLGRNVSENPTVAANNKPLNSHFRDVYNKYNLLSCPS